MFVFRIVPASHLAGNLSLSDNLDRIESLLTEALSYLGVGAKTAVGYGTFESVSKPLPGDRPKQWERKSMQGIIRTFISYSHADKDVMNAFLAKGAYLGVTPWVDRQELFGSAGHSLVKEIEKGLKADDIAAVTLFFSKHSKESDWVQKEIETANKLGIHIIPVLIGEDELRQDLQQWLKPENPIYLKPESDSAPYSWINSIIRDAHLHLASEVVLYLGYRDNASRPVLIPEEWLEKPVLDLRTPAHQQEDFYLHDRRDWTPETVDEYKKVENAISNLHRSMPALQKLYVAGYAPLGVGGIVGKCWDRGNATCQIFSWNSREKKTWTVDNWNPRDVWSPEQAEYLKYAEQQTLGEGPSVLLGHFLNAHQFEAAVAWVQEHKPEIGTAIRLSFPENITVENAAGLAQECAKSFAWVRRTVKPLPKTIYWAAGLPLALMPLVTHLARANGPILFLDERKGSQGGYLEAFELV